MRSPEKHNASNKAYREKHPEQVKISAMKYAKSHRSDRHEYHKKWRDQVKALVFTHYGNKCACCGETNIGFLTIDHINNDGVKMRKVHGTGTTLHRWLIKNDFPNGFQVLCYNCNCGRAHNKGVCPHVLNRSME